MLPWKEAPLPHGRTGGHMNEKMHRYADRTRDAEACALAAAVHYPRTDWVLSWEHVDPQGGSLVLLEVPEPETIHTVKYLLVHRTPRTVHRVVETDMQRHAEVRPGMEGHLQGLPDRIRDVLGLGVDEHLHEAPTLRDRARRVGGAVLTAGAGAVHAGIKGAGPKLREAGAAALEAAQPALREAAVEAIREALIHLTPEEKKALLREPWVTQALSGKCDPTAGHCYTASEVLYRLLGGPESGLTPAMVSHEGVPHWFVRDAEGKPVDATAEQFRTPIPYGNATPRSFPEEPSPRAHLLGTRVVERLTDADREAILMRAKRGLRTGARYGIMGPFGLFEHPLAGAAAKKTAEGTATLLGAPELAVPWGKAVEYGDLATRAPAGEPTVWDDAKEGYRQYQERKTVPSAPEDAHVVEKMERPVGECPGSLFHVTTYDRVERIADEGLEPGHGSQWAAMGGGYGANVAGRVFLAKGADSARGWFHATLYAAHANVDLREIEDLERTVPVILRIEKADNPRDDIEHKLTIDKRGSERESCSFFLEAAIGPEFLSFWHPAEHVWKPISMWDAPGVEHGIVGGEIEWQTDEDHGEPKLSDDTDVIDSWQPGGFKPDRPADFEAPLSVDDMQINETIAGGSMERLPFAGGSRAGGSREDSSGDWPTAPVNEALHAPWIRHEGKLGGPGYMKRTPAERHALLDAAVKHHGYLSTLGSIQALERSDALRGKYGKLLAADRGYLVSTYGSGSTEERLSTGRSARWDHASKVQTLLFSREHFTEMAAKKWARQHGFEAMKVDVTANYVRLRQRDPAAFVKGHFRTIPFGEDTGIKAVVGEPKSA